MSERGQKIFKWIVWIVLIVMTAIGIYKQSIKALNPPIDRAEWITKLEDSFGETYPESVTESKKDTTGEFAALTSMKMIGDSRLAYYTES